MDDDLKRPASAERVSARTTKRVGQLSDEERAKLTRELAARRAAVTDAAPSRTAEHQDPDAAAEVARVAAELHRTERRLDRVQRSVSHSRYQIGSSGPPSGRYARLLSRADRLERQLRRLR